MSKTVQRDDSQPPSLGSADTDPAVTAQTVVASDDTEELDDTDRELPAQGSSPSTPQMFEDTGVVIIDKPREVQRSDRFAVTFKPKQGFEDEAPTQPVDTMLQHRQTTVGTWPPTPREPAQAAPQIRERAFKRAGVYHVVSHPETKNEKN